MHSFPCEVNPVIVPGDIAANAGLHPATLSLAAANTQFILNNLCHSFCCIPCTRASRWDSSGSREQDGGEGLNYV
jgi:hypothetical protein